MREDTATTGQASYTSTLCRELILQGGSKSKPLPNNINKSYLNLQIKLDFVSNLSVNLKKHKIN